MSLGHGSSIIRDGLVLHLDAANLKSYSGTGTVWKDLSGNNRNASLINSVTYETNYNGEMSFDGTDDYAVVIYNSSNFVNSSFTWTAWVIGKQVDTSTHNMPDIGYGSGSWPRMGFKGRSTWVWQSFSNVGSSSNFVLSIGNTSVTNWSFIAFVADYENSICKTFYNGILANTANSFPDLAGNDSRLGIGRAGSTASIWQEQFIGSISSFSAYDRPLSNTEIQQNFEAVRGRYGI